MIIKEQIPIKLVNCCDAIYYEKDVIDAILWYTDKPVYRIKRISLYSGYPYVSIYYEKVHLHRLLMSWLVGRTLDTKEYVHHIDGNVLNCKIDNLELKSASSHQRLHNKNIPKTEEHKKKIGIANHNRLGMKIKRRINIPLNEIKDMIDKKWSINKIAKFYKCDWTTIKSRLNENPELLEGEKE